MTPAQILYGAPELTWDYTIPNDEDWNDGGPSYNDPTTGLPVALDGITVGITVRKAVGDPSVLWYADTTGPYVYLLPTTLGGVNSAWCVFVPAGQLSPFLPPSPAGQPYVYAVQGTAQGATATLASGNLTVTAGVA